MAHCFSIGFDWDEQGRLTGSVRSLRDCSATGNDLEEMLDRLEEEVRSRLHPGEESAEMEIELVGYDFSNI